MVGAGQAWANSVDSDQMSQNAASDQSLHNLQIIQQLLETLTSSKIFKCWVRPVSCQDTPLFRINKVHVFGTIDSRYLDLACLELPLISK